jgi:proline iminopeptidase
MTVYRNRRLSKVLEQRTLPTRDGHRIAFAVAGADDGIPVVVLHGGPGSGANPSVLDLFDLSCYKVVVFDQRGTGASIPRGSLRRNSTARLIDDIESLRKRLGIERWGVVGGSWGASLALAYAGSCPQSVVGVALRGLFLTSSREIDGLFIASRKRAPREWKRLVSAAQCSHPSRLLKACVDTLRSGRRSAKQRSIALAWSTYEDAVLASAGVRRRSSRRFRRTWPAVSELIGKYRIQSHFLVRRCWLGETRLLSFARRAAHAGVPLAAVHGTRDPVCPSTNLKRLVRAVPGARVEWVNAGHLGSEPALRDAVIRAVRSLFPR